jgi:transposase-like protein
MSQDSSPLSKSGKTSPTKVDPEVNAKPDRRKFSAEYKQRILAEADACTEAGQIGALLRREGLYSSNLTHWRQQRSEGSLKALSPKKRGPKPDPLASENATLRRRIERLEAELKRAETIIEVQKNSPICLVCQTRAARRARSHNDSGF